MMSLIKILCCYIDAYITGNFISDIAITLNIHAVIYIQENFVSNETIPMEDE